MFKSENINRGREHVSSTHKEDKVVWTVIYFVLFGSVTVLLRANSVIASASLSLETFRVIEKAVQTANATCAFESWVVSTEGFFVSCLGKN